MVAERRPHLDYFGRSVCAGFFDRLPIDRHGLAHLEGSQQQGFPS